MSDPRRCKGGLAAALALGLALWTTGVFNRSLWIDEFHSLHHARAADFPAFLASLETGNHPPLSFLLMRWSIALFGESAPALRWWSVVLGLATVALAAHVARRLPDPTARRAVPWLVVLSSFAFMIFTEARMYGLVALAALGLTETVLAALEGKSRGWWAAVLIPLGLHAHYYFLHYGFVLAVTTLAVAWARPETRPGFRRLLAPAAVGLALFLPWALTGLTGQFSHELPSGGTTRLYLNLSGFAQSLAHLLYMNASLGGRLATLGIALPGAVAGGVLGALGLARLWRARREGSGLFATYLLTLAFLAPAWSFLAAWLYERAGYSWRYIAGSCVPVLMVVAAGIRWRPWPRALLSGILFATLAAITLLNAFSPGQEDYRGAVRHILAHARPGDAILTKPTRHVDLEGAPTGWDYYRTRVERAPGAVEPVEYRTMHYTRALDHDRVWVFIRYRFPEEVSEALLAAYPRHEVTPIGPVLTVHLFSR